MRRSDVARLQILELPEGANDDRPPFVLVIDQVDDDLAEDIISWPEDIATRIGARQVLCFPGTIDIPANDTTAYLNESGQRWTRPDELRAQIQEEIAKAQAELTDVLNRQDAR
jgi:hypothetical protein